MPTMEMEVANSRLVLQFDLEDTGKRFSTLVEDSGLNEYVIGRIHIRTSAFRDIGLPKRVRITIEPLKRG